MKHLLSGVSIIVSLNFVTLGNMEEICDEFTQFNPYAKVYRKKNGPVLKSIESTGFLDLRRFRGVTLCLNGPAFLYDYIEEPDKVDGETAYSEESDDPRDIKIEMVMKNTKPKVYIHECFKINQVGRLSGPRKSFKLMNNMTVVGQKAFGLTLLAAAGDYRKPEFNWFHHKSFGHYIKYNDDIIASSFAMIGKKDYCFNDKLVKVKVYSTASTDYELCYRAQFGIKPAPISEAIFNHYHNPEKYNFQECGLSPDDSLINSQASSEILDPINEFDPFSIIDPKHWDLAGSRPIPRGNNRTFTALTPTSTSDFLSCEPAGDLECVTGEGGIYGEGVKYRVIKNPSHLHTDLTALTIPLVECIPLPFTQFNEDDSGLCSDKNSTTSECDLLARALLLDEEDMEPTIKWKMDILDLIAEIYGTICPAFTKDSAATVGRLFSYYLTRAMNTSSTIDIDGGEEGQDNNSTVSDGEQRAVWSFLLDELNTCKLNGKAMKFTWIMVEETMDEMDEYEYDYYDQQNEIDGKLLDEGTRRKRNSGKGLKPTADPLEDSLGLLDDITVAKRSATIKEKHLKKHEFHKVPIQEYFDKKSDDDSETYRKMFLGIPKDVKIAGIDQPLFYYEEEAENKYEFNIAIDLEWKIFGTVIGYCNSYYKERKAETFPRLYNTFFEDFLENVVKDWKSSRDNGPLRTIMSEFVSEAAHIWADSCFEASYIVSKSPTYRPLRPILVGSKTNYFTKLPKFAPQLGPQDSKI